MLKFGLFGIKTSDSERRSSLKELFTSFEECIEHRKDYADWWMYKGDISIEYYPANEPFSSIMYWSIRTDENGDWIINNFYNYSTYGKDPKPINPLTLGITDERYYKEMKKFVDERGNKREDRY